MPNTPHLHGQSVLHAVACTRYERKESHMSDAKQAASGVDANQLAPDTGKPLSGVDKARFMVGFIIFGIMWMASGTIGSAVLLPERFNHLGIGTPEVILTSMNSVGIIFALVANIVFGALSDRCHSRFGKRTPFVVIGGFVCGLAFWLTSTATTQFAIVAWWSLLQIGLNCMLAPAVAVLADRVPFNARGTLSAFYGGGAIVGQSLGTIIGSTFIQNPLPGFVVGTVSWIFTGILAVIIWPREKSATLETQGQSDVPKTRVSFVPPTKNCRDFYLALMGRLMLIFGYQMIVTFQLYIIERYIGLSAAEAAGVMSTMSVIIMVVSIVASLSSGAISDRIGRRKPLVILSSALIALGILVPFLVPSAASMLAFAAISGLGYGVYSSVDQALNVDVLPDPDDAGKDLGILNMANTLGQVLAPIVASNIYLATGGYNLVFPCAILLVVVGAVFIGFIRRVK